MNLQTRLLRWMLVCIGLAAGAGILTIFTSQTDVVGRVALTCLFGGIGLGCCMVAARMLDREQTRRAGLAGMWFSIIGIILCLLMVWMWGGARGVDEKLGLTAAMFAPVAALAVWMLRLLTMPRHRMAGQVGAVWLAVTFVLGQVSVWWPWTSNDWRVPMMAAALASLWVLVPLSFTNQGEKEARWWRMFAMVLLPVATLVWLGAIWKVFEPGDSTITAAIVAATVAALGNGSFLIPLQGHQRWLRFGTLACAAVAGVLVILASTEGFAFDQWGRYIAAFGLAFICGCLAMVVLDRLNRRAIVKPTTTGEVGERVELACPRCHGKHTLKLNGDRCPGCGLLITVKVARLECCTCSYPLDGITADKCPECGTAVEKTVKAALEEKTMQSQGG